MLSAICARNHGTSVSVGDVLAMLGPRSFAPFILVVGLLGITPIDSIPTVPTTFGIVVFLTAGQMLLGRRSLWLPGFITRRAVDAQRLGKGVDALMPAARWVDRLLGPRLALFTHGPFFYAIGACCVLLAAIMPLLEPLPMAANIPAVAFTAFGIALLAHDGAAALIGFAVTAAMFYTLSEIARWPW